MIFFTKENFFNFMKSKKGETIDAPSYATRHYLAAFDQYQEKKSFFKIIKFNWAACIFSWLWLFYRKMYLFGFIMISTELISYIFPAIFSPCYYNNEIQDDIWNPIGIFVTLIEMLIYGMIGTPLYLWFSERKIAVGQKTSGTTFVVSISIAILFIIIYILITPSP